MCAMIALFVSKLRQKTLFCYLFVRFSAATHCQPVPLDRPSPRVPRSSVQQQVRILWAVHFSTFHIVCLCMCMCVSVCVSFPILTSHLLPSVSRPSHFHPFCFLFFSELTCSFFFVCLFSPQTLSIYTLPAPYAIAQPVDHHCYQCGSRLGHPPNRMRPRSLRGPIHDVWYGSVVH